METSPLIFRSFGSSSNGNCYYLGTNQQGILLDAGISARAIHKHLVAMGLDWQNIMGVFITHDHADHIRAVGTIGERLHIPIYATPAIHEGLDRNYGLQVKLRTSRKYFEKGVPFSFYDMEINTFGISHDSKECVGYIICTQGQCFMLATDCGEPSDQMREGVRMANHLVIEANHDEQMLLNGPYPTYLKQRILSNRGHQSNSTCAQLLADGVHLELRNIFLCHLSLENNEPTLACQTVADRLSRCGLMAGQDYFLRALDRLNPSPVYILDDHIIKEPTD